MTIICIDLKSFYASVEAIDRGLDPLTTNLVVADASRTEKTICLAVSPALKSYGIPGRARLFEVIQKVKEVNSARRRHAPGGILTGSSYSSPELAEHSEYAVSFVTAVPRMSHYMKASTEIYNIYLRYIASEDIHVYSIDEVFIDATAYLKTYGMTAHELAMKMIADVLKETGITATAGIGSNLYLAKIAMDIVAKHVEPDKDGVRIAELDEKSYRKLLWGHRPITDFWRVGKGYARKLESAGIFTMGDVARCSLTNEDLLYTLFGINAELLIDHAWGWEPCTMKMIREYQPESNSISSAQVLQSPYSSDKARIIVQEMADALSLDLLSKKLVTGQVVLTVGYDRESLDNPAIRKKYKGKITKDFYGRNVPEHAHGSYNLKPATSSSRLITDAALDIYDRTINPNLLIRRINIEAAQVIKEDEMPEEPGHYEQLDLFTDYAALEREKAEEKERLQRERRAQEAMLSIKEKFGKNAILKGTSFREGATGRERNRQVEGHKE